LKKKFMAEWQLVKTRFAYKNPDPNIKYKRCGWDILIELLLEHNKQRGETNESRTNVRDPRFATFRASKLFVTKIYSLKTDKWLYKVTNQCYESTAKYRVGQWVKAQKWDPQLDIVCTHGIHYFNTLEAAYVYNPLCSIFFTEDGSVKSEDCYKINGICAQCELYHHLTRFFHIGNLISIYPRPCVPRNQEEEIS
jgi:hypothetical protein